MTQHRGATWVGILLLLVQLGSVWVLWFPKETDNRLLPILTPVSLKYEQQARQGERALNVQQVLHRISQIQPVSEPEQQQTLALLLADYDRMLALRNQRHELNVSLMNHGVSLVEILTEEQWLWVQSHRDTVKAAREKEEIEQILLRWKAAE
jgi:hypothetical protein